MAATRSYQLLRVLACLSAGFELHYLGALIVKYGPAFTTVTWSSREYQLFGLFCSAAILTLAFVIKSHHVFPSSSLSLPNQPHSDEENHKENLPTSSKPTTSPRCRYRSNTTFIALLISTVTAAFIAAAHLICGWFYVLAYAWITSPSWKDFDDRKILGVVLVATVFPVSAVVVTWVVVGALWGVVFALARVVSMGRERR